MRTSDENQSPFMRPNLMSSPRRGGLDDSILARLERGPRGHGGASWLRVAGYGTACLLVAALVTTLVWLATDSSTLPSASLRPGAVDASERSSDSYRARPGPRQAPEPGPAHHPALAALVVEASAEVLPPLRMLEPAPPPASARTAPPRPAARPLVPANRKARAPARVNRTTRPAAAASTPVRQSSRAPLRSAAPVVPAAVDAADDADVALISAVIYHANGHATGQARAPENASCRSGACRE